MHGKVSLYAQLLAELAEEKGKRQFEAMGARFVEFLKKKGDGKLRGAILFEFSRRWRAQNSSHAQLIGGEEMPEKMMRALEQRLSELGYDSTVSRNPALGEGVALFLGTHTLLDATVRGKLQRIQNQLHNA
ncbi:MAG: F0F1 ATP synthase subunit delta [Candidatus Yanofskybacteria bacterium]|nr:F0F1 ATP synthase subunit delta [Candidatus Yanofskybacteria bacterium]